MNIRPSELCNNISQCQQIHDVMFQQLNCAVILFDHSGELININHAAQSLLATTTRDDLDLFSDFMLSDNDRLVLAQTHSVRYTITHNTPNSHCFSRQPFNRSFLLDIQISLLCNDSHDSYYLMQLQLHPEPATNASAPLFEYNIHQQCLDNLDFMVLVIDFDYKIRSINQRGCFWLQHEKKDILGKNWLENFIPPDYRDDALNKFKRLYNKLCNAPETVQRNWEFPIFNAFHKIVIMEWNFKLLKDAQDQPAAILVIGEENSAKKEVIEKFQQKAAIRFLLYRFLNLALENQSLAQLLKRIIGMITTISFLNLTDKGLVYLYEKKTARFLLYSIINCTTVPVISTSSYNDFFDQQMVRDGAPIYSPALLTDDTMLTTQLLLPLVSGDNILVGFIQFFVLPDHSPNHELDSLLQSIAKIIVTLIQKKHADEELGLAHKKNKQLMDSISSVLIVVNGDNEVIYWNHSAEKTFHFSEQQTVGKLFPAIPLNWDWPTELKNIPSLKFSSGNLKLNNICYQKDLSQEGFLNITITPIKGTSQKNSEYLILGNDITENKVLESQLVQSQKLEAIGQLAAGIAHEINTPIQYVGDNIHFLNDSFCDFKKLIDTLLKCQSAFKQKSLTPQLLAHLEEVIAETDIDFLLEEFPKAVEQSLDGVDRVANIVKALKSFAYPDRTGEKTQIDVNQSIANSIIVARNEWKYVSDVETDFDPELPLVDGYQGEFNQVILNLIINAAHAIGEKLDGDRSKKGTITIQTMCCTPNIQISIKDTGTGIPFEIQDKIFNPFFTTKKMNVGTGQGLSLSHKVIVDNHGGRLSFTSVPGKGSCFYIILPIKSPSEGNLHD